MEQAAGININIPRSVVAEILLERFEQIGMPRTPAFKPSAAHALIGCAFMGGVYAGPTVHENIPYSLVLLPGESPELKWADAMKWAQDAGAELPSRFDALTLFTNLKSEFKPEYYWTSEQHASNESSAWVQNFGYGGQYYSLKDNDFRARAVRRLAI